MNAIQNINLVSLLDTLLSLGAAFLLGGVIGLERQFRQRTAGLRTNVLVAVGAALFVDIAMRLHGADGAVRVIAYVVSGVGFLGAGVIMREEGNVRGLNTAATLWGSAAVGAAAGSDLLIEAVLGAVFVLMANTLLRPVVHGINRQPLTSESVEVTHALHIIVDRQHQQHVIQQLEQALSNNQIPGEEMDIEPFGQDDIKIEATLAATAIDGAALDRLSHRLSALPGVRQAFWTSSTRE